MFNALDVAGVTGPADRLQIVYVVEQVKIALVRRQVVNDCRLWAVASTLEHSTAALVLALE